MNRSELAYLVVENYTQNELGVMEKTTTRHPVYVKVTSVT